MSRKVVTVSIHKVINGIAAFVLTIAIWGSFNSLFSKNENSAGVQSAELASEKEALKSLLKSKPNAGIVKPGVSDKQNNMLMNDPFVKEKWGLLKTKTRQAWEITKGSKDIVVAVIDTGLDIAHRDLSCNVFVNPGESGIVDSPECNKLREDGKAILNVAKCNKATNGIDDDKNGYVDDVHGWNFVQNNTDLTDTEDHGTHIAGIIGACGNKETGVAGVAPNVSIMPLKYYDRKMLQANNLKNTIDAIKYTVKMQQLNKNLKFVINYSGGGTEFSADEFAAIREAEKSGILFIAAAGNERSNTDEPGKHYYPADYGLTNIISVTAVNREETKVLASSNFGVRTVDLAAPGENIFSTKPGNTYGPMTGTSQATAFVTGVAVLIMANNKEFSAPEVKKYILRTGDEYSSLLSKTGTAKLLNSYRALTSMDSNVSFSGKIATNTSAMDNRIFKRNRKKLEDDANPVDVRNVAPSALAGNGDDETRTAEDMAFFGRDFLKAVKSAAKVNAAHDDEDEPSPAVDPKIKKP